MYEASIGHTVNTGQPSGAVVRTDLGHQRTQGECGGGLCAVSGKEGGTVALQQTFATRLYPDEAAKLTRLAATVGRTRSEVVRLLIAKATEADVAMVAGLGRKEAVSERG